MVKVRVLSQTTFLSLSPYGAAFLADPTRTAFSALNRGCRCRPWVVCQDRSGPAASTEITTGREGRLQTADISMGTWPMGLLFPNQKLGSEVWQRVPADTQMDVQHDRCVAKMLAMPDVLMFLEVMS